MEHLRLVGTGRTWDWTRREVSIRALLVVPLPPPHYLFSGQLQQQPPQWHQRMVGGMMIK